MNDETLKRCPHCGGTAYINSSYSYRHKTHFVYVKCSICGAQGKTYCSTGDPEKAGWNNQACTDAVAAWNMRTPQEVITNGMEH